MEIILNGLKLGIILAFLVGPVFFTIIQTSVEKGFWNGVIVSLGVSLSDILYVTVCYFGLVQFINEPGFRVYLAYAGGAILILFGLYHLFIKSRRNAHPSLDVANEKKMYRYFIKGFIINGLSPMVLIFWIGTISIASIDFGYSKGFEFFLFFGVVLGTVLATDILKAYLADKLRRLVTQRLMKIMNVIVGICLIIFGGRLILLADTFLT
ncbi:MAG TPA: LysE family transporter [Cyclobacteriaceae bacterium]|nr:LysE family transporter [Cyclobacteriaceae bacterium]